MALYRNAHFVLILFVLMLAACTRPVLIGSDFLEEEKASLDFKDDFTLSFATEETDSVLVHSNSVAGQLVTYLLGELTDPIFGKSSAEIYAQPIIPTVATALKGSTLDSTFLDLAYDTTGIYGSIMEPVTIEVYRMIERPDFNQKYYSNHRFMASSELLGSLTFVPKPKDSVTVFRLDEYIKVAPFVRIPLNTLLLNDLTTQDSIVYQHIDSFLNYFNGLYIRMTNANNTMLGFDLVNSISGLATYYKSAGDTTRKEFKFLFTSLSVKAVHMEHDYSGTLVGASLTPEPENDYWFTQGLSGVTTKMTVNGLPDLGNAIINQAEIEFYCTFPTGDEPGLYPPCPFLVAQYATDTSITNALDVTVALFRTSGSYHSSTYETLFGGVLKVVEPAAPAIYKYNMKITSLIKDIYQGKKENIIYFNPIDKGSMPCRSVLIGPSDPLYAPRLKVYYTAL
jgi:hypothetical protein